MAPVDSRAFSDGDVLFNRVNVALVKRQGLLASLMGVASEDKPKQERLPETQHQEEDGFSTEPELLGIGGKTPDYAEIDRQKRSSNHELKRQLLGRDHERRQKSTQDLRSNREVVSSLDSGSYRKAPLNRPSKKAEPDSEDDAGRSSLGKRKINRSHHTEKRAFGNAEAKEQDEEQKWSDKHIQPESAALPALPQAKDELDKMLAEQSSQKKINKKRKKIERKKSKRKEKLLAVQQGEKAK